jgi:hypothetical protein
MAYTITKTDGTTLGTILDGTINTSFTSLTLIGRNYANYGQFIANNLVRLVENFAYSSSPANPLAGQLWWNTADKRLRVYTGAEYKIISACTAQTSPPVTTVAGDLWFDTQYGQFYVYSSDNPTYDVANWILVGPERNQSGAKWETIFDTSNIPHQVLSLKLNNGRAAIISYDAAFVPNVTIAGYTSIRPGINGNTSVASATFWGLANNSSYLGGQPASNYLRSDIDDTTDGALTISNNNGLTVGLTSNLQITTTTAGHTSVKNTKNNGDIIFYTNVAAVNTAVLTLDGATGNLVLNNAEVTNDLSVSNNVYAGGDVTVAGQGTFTGNLYAPTQGAGTSDTTVATTEFVASGLSGIFRYKIYDGNSHMWINDSGTGTANLVLDSRTVMTASIAGVALLNGASAITQTQVYDTTGNARIATTQYVHTAQTWWGNSTNRSAKWVSTSAPDIGVNDVGSNNGDFWFQIET